MANQINTRIIHKHDTEANWNKATSFIPKKGEIIIYDRDNNYAYERFKIGDGVTAAPSLPFATKNAFGNVKVGSTTIAADSFSDTLTLTAGANISLTPSTSGDSVTIAATDTTYNPATQTTAGLMSGTDKTNLDNLVDAIQDKVDKVSGKGLSTNDYTTAEKTKLEGIEIGANKTVVDSSLSSTSQNPVQNKVINSALSNKVDKVTGKALSTNDFDNELKSKLDGIEPGANNYSLPTASSSTLGGVKTTSNVTSTSGLTPTPIINGVPYYKNSTYNLGSFGVTATKDELNILDGVTATTAEINYLDGVSSNIQNQLDGKVNAVEGKGLSTNDYTTAEKDKLFNIPSGAEVNQNAFSNVVIGSTTIAAETKTDTLTFVAGSNITLTPDATNDKITISATDTKLALDTALTTSGKAADAKAAGDRIQSLEDQVLGIKKVVDIAVEDPTDETINSISEIIGYIEDNEDAISIITNKQDKITGAATTIASSNLTANRALISNSSGKVAVSDITATELNYLDGATSNIQNQITNLADTKASTAVVTTDANGLMSSADKSKLDGIAAGANKTTVATSITSTGTNPVTSKAIYDALSGKQASITGAATTITGTNLTANRALVSNGSGKVAVSAVTSTELGYLDGVTSNIQSQIDAKASKDVATTSANGLMSATDKNRIDAVVGTYSLGSFGNKTIADLQTALDAWLENYCSIANASAIFYANAHWKTYWNNKDTTSIINEGGIWTVTVIGTYTVNSKYVQLRISTYTDESIYYCARINDSWGTVHQTAFKDDLTLSILGITASAAELNKLDGVTATTTELNYVDGVTSNIQSQLDGKAPTSHASTATTYGAASADNYGHAKASKTTPKANGTAAVGSETSSFARGDHVHPLQTSVAKLTTARYIDGLSFDGSANVTRYATCSTAAATVAKVASVTTGNTFNLATGTRVTVKFTNANSAANPTLNIGSTGAKAIYWHGAALASSQYWQAGAVLDFVYNGTQWELIGIAKDNNTTYSAGNGLFLSSTTFNIGEGTGISVDANAVGLATVDTVTAGTYGPSAAVTGNNNTTMNVPEITVDAYGRVTNITNRVYTAKNSTYTIPTSLKNPNSLTVQGNGTNSFTYDGSAAKTLNIKPGTNITVTSDTSGNITIGNSYSYSLPNATGTTKGGVIVGSNITVSSGTISLTKANVTNALGYTPPTSNTTYSAAKYNTLGLVKPAYTSTGAATLTTTAASNTTTPTIAAKTTTSDRYYAVEADKNGVLFVNVPWSDTNTTYTLSGLGGIGTITASGTAPLTLSATKSGTSVTITGSVATASSSLGVVKTTSTVTSTSGLTACPIINGVVYYKDTNTTYGAMTGATSSAAGTSGLVPAPAAGKQSSFLRGDGTWATPTDTKVTQTAYDTAGDGYLLYSTSETTNTADIKKNTGIRIRNNVGTTSAVGESAIILGNSIASGTAGNKQGRLYIYGSNTGYHILEVSSITSNQTHILPTTGGTLLNTGNYTSYTVKKDGTGASGDWNINAATASTWKTARTLTIGAKAQSVNGSANVSWSLYDILKVGSIGNDTSWEITEPGVYHVSGSAFTGSGNPEAANGGLAPYRYGQLIVSKGGPTGGLVEFYISHADSKPNSPQYGIKFRSGWDGAYQTTWRTLVDNVNISNFAISTNGGTLTGGNLIIDRGTEEPKYAFYRTVSDVVHRGLLNLNSAGAVKLGYYDANWGELNYMILSSNATTLGKPLAVGSGGTGATTPAAALTNLGGVGYTVVSDISSLL